MTRPGPGAHPPAHAGPHRLFFALWPDAPARARLEQATQAVVQTRGGRPVPAEQLHLTLAFLGAVPAARRAELLALAPVAVRAAGLVDAPLALTLGQLERWSGPQVLCVLPIHPPAALGALARSLTRTLGAAGFTPDLKPFRPHVTVARKVVHPSETVPIAPVRWTFERVALIESRTLERGPVYSVVETCPLYGG